MRHKLLPALLLAGALLSGCAVPRLEPTETPNPPPLTVVETPVPTPTESAEPTETPTLTENVEPTPTPTSVPGLAIEKDVSSWISPLWTESTRGDLGERSYVYQSDGLSILIHYPVLYDEGSDDLNALFRATAVDEWEDNDLKGDGIRGDVSGDWAVSRSDERLLSIRFREEYCIGMANPSQEERAVTIDRESGKRLSLADIVDTGDDFKAWLYAQNWTALNRWNDGGEVPSEEEYIKEQLGWFSGSTGPTDHVEDFYLTDTELVIIAWYLKYDTHLSVPLSDLTLKGDDLWNG